MAGMPFIVDVFFAADTLGMLDMFRIFDVSFIKGMPCMLCIGGA